MPVNPSLRRSQQLRSRGSTAKQSGGVTATQFMLMTVVLSTAVIVVNVYHLMPAAGMNEPLARQQPFQREVTSKLLAAETSDQSGRISSVSHTKGSQQIQPAVPTPETKYHIIFSSGCSSKQDFQSYIFFFHAMKSKQPGQVTRIASCNNAAEEENVRQFHQTYIQHMSPYFHLHTTPDYSHVNGIQAFHYFNKPFSTYHWMKNALGYTPQHNAVGDNPHDDTIVILCDPDQIIMRPFTNNYFANETEIWKKQSTRPILNSVTHGKPMGAMYGFGNQWLTKTNITRYVSPKELPSHVQTMAAAEASENYAVGPPYIATAHDFWKIATTWKDFVPLIQKYDYPHLLAEMFAYCLAAAHLNLPHQIAASFMVSDASAGGMEGWDMLKDYSKTDLCTPGAIDQDHLPHVLHYCQRYLLGKFVIGKHRIPPNFLSCEEKLFTIPPPDLGERFNFAIEPDQVVDKKLAHPPSIARNHAFMVCHLLPYLNEAAIYWKDHHCEGKTRNKEETLTFYKSMQIDASFLQ